MNDRLICALDVPTGRQARELVSKLHGVVQWYKIGLELFCAEGPGFVEDLAKGHNIMLDLKLHDIPKTVERAVGRVKGLGVRLLTVHTSGGGEMLESAAKAAGEELQILGVTVLTSMSQGDLKETGVSAEPAKEVVRRADLALKRGLDGVVCSPLEIASVRKLNDDLLIVTPGVRPAGSARGDQKRIATPGEAIRFGANYLVVGRPIRDAESPRDAALAICQEMSR